MYPTFTDRQLRALSIITPGTLALRGQDGGVSTFLVSEADRVRSHVWAIDVDMDGNVWEYLTRPADVNAPLAERIASRVRSTTYADLIERDEWSRAADRECAKWEGR